MHHSGGMRGAESGPNLRSDPDRFPDRQALSGHALTQCRALDIFHCQEELAIGGGAKRVNGANVRMVQGRCGAGFEAQPRHAIRIGCDVSRKDLDRDAAIEVEVARQPDLPHAAAANRGEEFVSVYGRRGVRRHRNMLLRRARQVGVLSAVGRKQ